VGKVQEKVDSLSERTDRDGIIIGERGGLDQTDFDSFFTRNLLKQKCRYFLSQYLSNVITNVYYSKYRKCSENEAQSPIESTN
jgi:hypothetical protein